MTRTRHRALHSVRGCALFLLLGACGDGVADYADAGLPVVLDAQVVDAPPTPRADANLIDAAIPPDAVPGSSCAAAIVLQPGNSHLGDTSSQGNSGSRSCAAGSSTSPDTLYRIDLPDVPTDLLVTVRVDEDLEQPFDAVLAVESACGVPDTEVACSDFGLSESLEALAMVGPAFIHVDGTAQYGDSPSGSYQLDVQTRSIAGLDQACDPEKLSSRCEAGLRCVASLCQSDSKSLSCTEAEAAQTGVDQTGRTHAFMADHFQGSCAFDPAAGASEALFSLSLAQAADLRISTDLGPTDFDTVIYLLSACEGTELACHDDVSASLSNFNSELVVSAVPAGDYIIVIDGSSPQAPTGNFGLRVDVTPL